MNNCLKISIFIHAMFGANIYNKEIMEFNEQFIKWQYNYWETGYLAYKILKSKPIEKKITFLVAQPQLLFENYNKIKKSNFEKLKNAFIIDCGDNCEQTIPVLIKLGISVIFACSAMNKKYEGITIISIPYPTYNGIAPAQKKDIFYSFIGCPTHPLREKIFSMNHPKKTVIIKRDKFHFFLNKDQKLDEDLNLKKEYQDILSRSRYSLCPRGNGAGTIRFWESLQAGAIPILISDDYLLPMGFDWNKCIIRIAEKNVENISKILEQIDSKREEELRNNCLAAFPLFSGDNIVKVIRNYYES